MLHSLEWSASIQAVMRYGVVAGDRRLEQLLEFVERDVETQVALGIGQRAADVTRVGSRVTR